MERSAAAPFPVSTLCKNCSDVSTYWQDLLDCMKSADIRDVYIRGFTLRHFTELGEIAASAARGCSLCIQLHNSSWGLEPWSQEESDEQAGTMILVGDEDHTTLQLTVCCCISGMESLQPYNHDELDISTLKHINLKVSIMPILSPLNLVNELNLEASFNTRDNVPSLPARWLGNCQLNHALCQIMDPSFLPTRLIQIDLEHPKLVLSSADEVSSYATLSHCWGRCRFTILLSTNLEEFQTRIPETALSKTFRDAIFVARTTGLKYIWIDSICIIQNSPEDWQKESLMMADVYSNSSLNIIATAASDGTFGLFSERDPVSVCLITMCGDSSHLYHCVTRNAYDAALWNMPLLKRGWTLQERLLPPRSMQFTAREVFWECNTSISCESSPLGFQKSTGITDHLFYEKRHFSKSLWIWAIELYSTTQLTVETDKLVAISGLAQRVHSQTGIRYLAGLWEEDLETELLWVTLGHGGSWPTKPTKYVAPSWSWASLTSGAIELYNPEGRNQITELCIKIVSATIDPPDSFAQVTAGTLVVEAKFLVACNLLDFIKSKTHDWFLALGEMWKSFTIHFYLDCQEVLPDTLTYLIPVIFGLDGVFNPVIRTTGLLLRPTGNKRGEYYRIGLFTIRDWGGPQSVAIRSSILRSFFNYQAIKAKRMDCTQMVEKEGDVEYMIEII